MATRKKPTPKAPTQDDGLLVAQIRDWIEERDTCDDLVRQWQALERQLVQRARTLGMTLSEAGPGNLSEARAMRSLMRRIRASDRRLESKARRILRAPSSWVNGALAKIELGLRLQAHRGGEDVACALVRAGFEELQGHRGGR